MDGLNSNLNLNAGAAPSVIPRLGAWGPAGVPSTKSKKRMRWIVVAILLAAMAAVTAFGWWVWTILR